MAEILVLAEHVDDDVKKVTLELITLARRFGEPSVVWTGPGADQAQARLAEYGAATEVVDHAQRPPRAAGTVVKDEGDGGAKVAEFLAAQKFI